MTRLTWSEKLSGAAVTCGSCSKQIAERSYILVESHAQIGEPPRIYCSGAACGQLIWRKHEEKNLQDLLSKAMRQPELKGYGEDSASLE